MRQLHLDDPPVDRHHADIQRRLGVGALEETLRFAEDEAQRGEQGQKVAAKPVNRGKIRKGLNNLASPDLRWYFAAEETGNSVKSGSQNCSSSFSFSLCSGRRSFR